MNSHYLSVVIPAYKEAKNIIPLVNQLENLLKDLDYEIIVIDDGSPDETFMMAKNLSKGNNRIKVLRSKENRGKSSALRSGFAKADAQNIIMIDADSQYNPAEIPKFLKRLADGCDVVNALRDFSKYPFRKRIISEMYNLLTKLLLEGGKIHDMNSGLKAFKREVLEQCLKKVNWRRGIHRYLISFCILSGYKVVEIKVHLHSREIGKSRYGFKRIIEGAFLLGLLTLRVRILKRGF